MCGKKVFAGFSLIEVMVSFIVLTVGLLAQLGSAAKAMHVAREAYYQDVATHQVYLAHEYGLMSSDFVWSQYQVAWNRANKRLLPSAEGKIEQHEGNVTISLCWFYGKKYCYGRVFYT